MTEPFMIPVEFVYGPLAGTDGLLEDVPPIVQVTWWEGDIVCRATYGKSPRAGTDGAVRYLYADRIPWEPLGVFYEEDTSTA